MPSPREGDEAQPPNTPEPAPSDTVRASGEDPVPLPATVLRPSGDAPSPERPGETPATILGPTLLGTPTPLRPPATASPPPERFGRYELRGQIGRGGMGTVYRAFDTQLKREVALKVLRVQDGDRTEQFLRFRREAEAAARLRHPNLVVTYDLGVEGEHHYLTMELVEGGSFARHLANAGGRLPPQEAMRFARDVALGLARAHESGIVHRDLKPENILLENFEGTLRPKISDFGLARAVSETGDARLTLSGSIVGTPSYMAPEQAEGKLDEVDARSDVYALGAVLYEAVCGRTPYPGTDPMKVLMSKIAEDPPRPSAVHPGIARDVETIIEKAMARDRGRRYATARAMAEDLDRCLIGEAILARPESGFEAAWRLVRRRRGLVAAAALVAVLLAIAGGAAWNSRTARHAQGQLQEEALRHLRSIAKTNLDASLALRRAGRPLSEQKRFLSEVEKAAREALERGATLAEPHYQLGRLYRAQLRFDDALAEQERALAKDPDLAPARYERALLDLRRWEQRLADLRAAWVRDEGRRLAESGQLERAGMGEAVLTEPPADVELAARDPEASRLRDRIAADLAKVEERLPGSPESSCLRGLVQLHERKSGGAARVEQALASDPTLEEAYEGLARAARARSDMEEAARIYGRGIEADAGYVPFWTGRAELAAAEAERTAMRGGDPIPACERADKDLTRALELDPSSIPARVRRGAVLAKWGDRLGDNGADPEPTFNRALADLTAAVASKDAEAWQLRGQLQVMWSNWLSDHAGDPRERYALAVADFGRAIAAAPLSAEAWRGRGGARRHWGLFQKNHGEDPRATYGEALSDFAKALELDPRGADVWRARAEVRLALAVYGRMRGEAVWDRLEEAGADLDRALALEPASTWTRGSRAQLHMFWGECVILHGEEPAEQYALAIADLDLMLKAHPSPGLLTNRATCRIVLADHERTRGRDAAKLLEAARADLDAARPASAADYVFWCNLARLELVSSQLGSADPFEFSTRGREACANALRINFGATEALIWLGVFGRLEGLWHAERGEDPEAAWAGARADFDRALEIAPNWDFLWQQRGRLGLDKAAHEAGHDGDATDAFAAALADFSKVVEFNPACVDGLTDRAETKRRWAEHDAARGKDTVERLRSALEDLDRAVKSGPNHPGARVERARVRLALGDRAGAEADLEHALKVAPAWRDVCAPLLEQAKRN